MRSRYQCAGDGDDFGDQEPVESAHRIDPATAARMFVQRECSTGRDSYSHWEGGARVRVRDEHTGEETWWVVSVEFVETFWVHRDPDGGPKNTDGTSKGRGGEGNEHGQCPNIIACCARAARARCAGGSAREAAA